MPVFGAPYTMSFENISLRGHKFWTRLHQLFPGKDTYSIDSAELFKQINAQIEKSCQAKIRIAQSEFSGSEPSQMQATIDMLTADATLNKIYLIDRDQNLISQVASHLDTDTCVIGKMHALTWFYRGLFPDAQFSIDDTDEERHIFTGIRPADSSIDDLVMFRQERTELNVFERNFNIWNSGNFVNSSRPAIRGTWDTANPMQGYFEIYSDDVLSKGFNGQFRGVCYDNLGEAIINGQMREGKLHFTKEYIAGHLANHDSVVEYTFKLRPDSFSKGANGKFKTIKDVRKDDCLIEILDDVPYALIEANKPVERLSLVGHDVRNCNITFGSFESFIEQNKERILVCASTKVPRGLYCDIRGYHITESRRDPSEDISMLFCQECCAGMPGGCGFNYKVEGSDKIYSD